MSAVALSTMATEANARELALTYLSTDLMLHTCPRGLVMTPSRRLSPRHAPRGSHAGYGAAWSCSCGARAA
eukprot:165382-Pyramimonas_sp.AAC.1